mgnify:CR=1 FL=1
MRSVVRDNAKTKSYAARFTHYFNEHKGWQMTNDPADIELNPEQPDDEYAAFGFEVEWLEDKELTSSGIYQEKEKR